jgi:hypothetical protein
MFVLTRFLVAHNSKWLERNEMKICDFEPSICQNSNLSCWSFSIKFPIILLHLVTHVKTHYNINIRITYLVKDIWRPQQHCDICQCFWVELIYLISFVINIFVYETECCVLTATFKNGSQCYRRVCWSTQGKLLTISIILLGWFCGEACTETFSMYYQE